MKHIMKPVKNRRRGEQGFTLAETLMAVLILLMVSAVVAAGVPAAANALSKTVAASNAQVLLSTTITALRDELSMADIPDQGAGTSIAYTNSMGNASTISSEENAEENGIYLRVTAYGADSNSNRRLLVSQEAATSDLYATFDSIVCSNGVVTVTGLAVKRGSNTVAGPLNYKIRVTGYVETPTPGGTGGGG